MVDSKTLKQYKGVLASFMNFVHDRPVGGEYSRDHVHSMEVLAAITPNDVLRYMNLKTFGTTDPPGDANPTSARANTLAVDKKAISFFMPNRDKWSATRMEGNPTQSMQVNSLIKRVRKKEARKQSVKSQARRPILGQEFVALHELLNQHDGRRRNGNQGGCVCWKNMVYRRW